MTQTRELAIERATAEALRPFGELVGGELESDGPDLDKKDSRVARAWS